VVPSGRGRGSGKGQAAARSPGTETPEAPATAHHAETERHRALSWAARLKRVFTIDITACHRCGGTLRVIASIEEADVIRRILDHLGGGPAPATRFDLAPPGRGPPPGTRLI
jgi:hypothetical protein